MARRAMLQMTSKLKTMKARVREVIDVGRQVQSRSNRGGHSQFIRLIMYNEGEGSFRSNFTRERRRAAPGHAARKHSQGGSTLKDAVAKLLNPVHQGILADSYAYNHVLQWCSREKDLKSVKQVHDSIKDSQMEQHPYVANMLLECYIECGRLETARETFDKLLTKDTITWNKMIAGCVKHDQAESAFEMYKKMRNEGGQPNAITYVSVLKACSSPAALKWGRVIHAHTKSDGLQADVRVGTALVRMFANCGCIEDAKAVFGRLSERDVVSWNVMIGGLAEHGLGHEAFSMFLRMRREGFTPNAITYLSILNPCSSTGAVEWVKKVHACVMRAGPEVDVRVGNALIHMYSKVGLIQDARRVFDTMRTRSVISWAVMIGGLAQHGHGREALQIFEEMKFKGVKPNGPLFVAVLSACSHAGLVEEGRLEFASMRRDHCIEPNLDHYTCMVDLLGRAGHLKDAKLFIHNMPIKPDVVIWRALLFACRIHQNMELAELAAKECLKLKPTCEATYVLLSNVYAAVGEWDKVSLLRGNMEERGICKDPGRCWISVDNKVHHFVVGDTSHAETRQIYSMLSTLSEKLKSEGYIADTRLVMRNIDEDDKESGVCSHSEKLAIAYGLMHVPSGKTIRVYKNLRICQDCHTATKLISKITGREIVARDANRFHHFQDGSCSCGDYW